jgi:hypothetical protein
LKNINFYYFSLSLTRSISIQTRLTTKLQRVNSILFTHRRHNRYGAKAVQILFKMRDHQPNQDLFQRVNLYLDRAMSQEDEVNFQQELSKNPAVTEALLNEQSFRDLLKNSVYRRKASPALIQSIKDKIRKAPM